MRILVTGGAGFIGSHIVDAYVREGHEVHVLDSLATGRRENLNGDARFHQADLLDADAVERVFGDVKPEVVNHLAAQASVKVSTGDPAYDLSVNGGGTARLVDRCIAHGVKKLIYASSGGTVYGHPERLPIDETHPLGPVSPYGVSKLTGEYYVRLGKHIGGLDYTIFRYSNAFGPRQDPHGEAGVVAIFTGKMLAGETCTIDGDGEQQKDYVFVGDIARANVLALAAGSGQAYNIGAGKGTSVNQIFTALESAIDSGVAPVHGPPRVGDVRNFWLDCSLAQADLGWKAEVSFEDGIRRTVEWYRARA